MSTPEPENVEATETALSTPPSDLPVEPPLPGQPGSTAEGGVLPSVTLPDEPAAGEPATVPDMPDGTPDEPDPPEPPISDEADGPVALGIAPGNRQVNELGEVTQGRTDDDALHNQFAVVVSGPEAGRYGVLVSTVTTGEDGYPLTVTFKTRDARDELLTLNYADLRPSAPGGRL